jgi:transcriptional/translational regulatory protein YebC/TACO1
MSGHSKWATIKRKKAKTDVGLPRLGISLLKKFLLPPN